MDISLSNLVLYVCRHLSSVPISRRCRVSFSLQHMWSTDVWSCTMMQVLCACGLGGMVLQSSHFTSKTPFFGSVSKYSNVVGVAVHILHGVHL